MSSNELEDWKPHNVAQQYLEKTKRDISKLLGHEAGSDYLRQMRLVSQINGWLDYFQQNPQLLDPHLASFVPSLVTNLLEAVKSDGFHAKSDVTIKKVNALSVVVCHLCKLRGRKVIARFLENEPRHLGVLVHAHGILRSLEQSSAASSLGPTEKALTGSTTSASWQSAYVVLLWLSHLVLTPFDLSTLSGEGAFDGDVQGLELPEDVPLIVKRLLDIGLASLDSPTNQRVVAADLLVRLALRPDMRKLGVLHSCISWALRKTRSQSEALPSIHKFVGLLSLLNGVAASGSMDDIGLSIVSIYDTIVSMFEDSASLNEVLQGSAVAKRLAVKLQRNILVQLLTHRESPSPTTASLCSSMLDTRSTLEEVVDFLLRSLADRDTQVRLAASKALSVIAQKLNQEMADEIVEAIIGSLNEDVLVENGIKSYTAVNALRWHGLTMTLSHTMFRRIPSPGKLLEILEALYMALGFEQRSSSGHSVGGNVRDAANFGLWSLARRYATNELTGNGSYTTLQTTAYHLICAACFDPIGNVRRGSSAALQELVGRHPDTIEQGIALIQIVDYQAVGLRSRAMEQIAVSAANLSGNYRTTLRDAIYDWRGLQAPDQQSRESAAKALFSLIELKYQHADAVFQRLLATPKRDTEARHGLLMALAEMVKRFASYEVGRRATDELELNLMGAEMLSLKQALDELFSELTRNQFQARALTRRRDLLGRGIIVLVTAYVAFVAQLLATVDALRLNSQDGGDTYGKMFALFTEALEQIRDDSLELVQTGAMTIAQHSDLLRYDVSALARDWLRIMKTSRRLVRTPGLQIALGTAYGAIAKPGAIETQHQPRMNAEIIEALILNARPLQDIETRAVAIRALSLTFSSTWPDEIPDVMDTFHQALNDYTNTERGDIGSLVRVEALKAMRRFWDANDNFNKAVTPARRCYTSTLTLAVGKLDKVRVEAVQTLRARYFFSGFRYPEGEAVDAASVSDFRHFRLMAELLLKPSVSPIAQTATSSETAMDEMLAVLEGIAISAGSGTSSTLPAAREALAEVLEELPTYPDEDTDIITWSIFNIANALTTLLSKNLEDDRVNMPLLETIGFLLDYGTLQRLAHEQPVATDRFKYRALLSLVQKSHFKSTNIPKLLAAINVYSGLLDIPEIRQDVLAKLINMLLHPFPRVRVEVAKVLWTATCDEELKPKAWSSAPAEHRSFVAQLKKRHVQS